jgi:hypothetical protein
MAPFVPIGKIITVFLVSPSSSLSARVHHDYLMTMRRITTARIEIPSFLSRKINLPHVSMSTTRNNVHDDYDNSLITNKLSSKVIFQYVPNGKSIKDISITGNIKTIISCDGRIDNTDLELTHWNGNITPDIYYDDTSTGMALKYVSSLAAAETEDNDNDNNDETTVVVIVNNHYDTDGVLSCFTCMYPQIGITI